MRKSRSMMDYSGKKNERRPKAKNENRSRKSPARYDNRQDYDETYQKPTARRKKSKSSRVAITDSPTFSKSSESPTNRHEGSAVVTSGDESSSLPKELNYEYFEKLGSNLCRAGELLDEHERGIVWQAADVITCIPEYCPPRCYMTKLCRCNTCCERCCVDPEHRLTGFHSNVKDEATDVPDEEGLTLSGSSDTSVASLLGDVSSEEGKSRGSTRLAIAARDAKRAVRLAKQFRAAARTIDSLECSNESEHRMRALYTKELMDKAVFYAKKANEALAGYAALRRALRGIPDATSGDESTRFDALQGEQTPYRPAPYPAQGYGSAMEFAMRYPQQPSAQSPFGQGVRGTVGQGYRFGGPRGVQGPLDAQRLRWASAPVVGRPPSHQTALSLSRLSDIVMSKAQQASEDALRLQRISNETLTEARVLEGVSNDRLPPFELKGARSSYWLPAAVPEPDQRYVQDRAADLRPSGAVAFDDTMTECAIGKDGHMLRIPEHTKADSDRQPEQLNDQMMRISTEEKRSARKDGKSDLKVGLTDRGGPKATGPTTTPPPNRVARRASVSAAVASQMQQRAAIELAQGKSAKASRRRASVSSIQQELSDTAQSPQPRKTKSLAARRASVGAGLLLKLGAHMKDGADDLSPDTEPAASPDSTNFKARATRRASVSSKAYSAHPLNEDADSFKARATRRASVSSKGLPTSPDRITADHDSLKARSLRRASVSSKTISPSEANTRNEQYHFQTKALRRLRDSLKSSAARAGADETRDKKRGRIVVKIKPPPVLMSSKKVGTRHTDKDKDLVSEICDECLLNKCGSQPTDPRDIQKIIDEGVGAPKYTKDMDSTQASSPRIPEIVYELSEQSLDIDVIPSERCKEAQTSLPFDLASSKEHHWGRAVTSTNSNATKEAPGNKNRPSAKSASRHQKNIGRTSLEKQARPDSHGGDAHAHLKVLPSDTYVFTSTTVAIAGGDTTNPKAAKASVEGAKKKPKESDAAGSAKKSSRHSNESPKRESGAKKHSTSSKESLKHKSGAEKPSRPSNESLRHEAGKESTSSESGARNHSKESLEGGTGAEKPSRPSNGSMKREAGNDSLKHDSKARKHSTHSKESVKGETRAERPLGPSNESLKREAGATNKRRSSLKSTKGSSYSHNEKSKHEKVLPTRVEKGAGERDEKLSERDTTGKPENRADKKADEGKRKALKGMRISDEHVKDRKASVGKGEDDNGSKNVKTIDEGIKRRNASVKKGEDESGKALDKQTESGSKREGKEKVRGSGTEQAAEEIRDKTDKTGGKEIRDSDDETPQPTTTDGARPKNGDKSGEKRPSAGYLKDAKKTAGKQQPSKVVESVDATKAASQPHDGGSNAPLETQAESNAPSGFLSNIGGLASWYSAAGEKGRAEDTTRKHTTKADTPRVLATNTHKVATNFDADQQTEIPVTVDVADSSAEPPQKILRSTNEKRESTAAAQDDADFVNDRYKQVAASSAYFPEGEEIEIRPMDDDGIYDYQQLAFADRQNIIGSSSSGVDVAGSQRDDAREVGQRSAELVLPKKLAFGAVDDWTVLSPLEKFAEHSDSDHAMDRSRPERSEYTITSEAAKLDPRNARMYETEQTRELRDDIAAEEDLQPEGNYSLDQQQEWEQPEGELPYGEPLERELPEEELPEGESPQEETPQQDISEQEARVVENGIAVNIPELEDMEGVEQPQYQGINEVIELHNVDYELQSRPHAPLRGPDLQDFNFWDLDGPAVLYPESRLVFALALVAGMWILYIMFTTKATINRKPFLELFTALATEHEIPRGRIMTETFAVNHLKTKETAGTVMGSVVSARPWLLYFCDTPYCKESALQLAKMLGEDPCFNFYSYTCGKLTRKWNPMVGSALSTDAFIINEAAKLAAGHILNREHPGMKAARNLLEACLDHENDGQWSRTELSELFFEYFGSSWPAENNPLTMEAVWVIAGRLARDLKLEALARVSVGIHPEENSASVPTIGEPVLLYQRADFEEPGYTEILETAIGQTVTFISPASNGAQHVSSIKTTMELLADMVATYPASYVGAKEHRMTKVRVLSPGVRAFLRTVFPDSVKVAENADILIKSPRFFEKLQGSRSTLLDPQAVFNYVGFRVMVHFAAFLPQPSVRHLRALEANFLLPENASAQDFCTREVERVFPAIYARAFALQTANLSTWVNEWPSQLKRIFLQGLGFRTTRIRAPQAAPTSDQDNDAGFTRRRLDSLKVEAAVPLWIVNDSSFGQYTQELERQLSVTLNVDPSNSLKRLCFFAKMLRENEIQQALLGTSANQTAMSLFGTEARYDARNSAIYMPLVTVNWSVPASSVAFAIHAARYAVRVFRALGLALRLGYAHASEQRAGSDIYSKRYQGQLNITTRCLVEQYENASRSLKSAFLQKTADRTPLGAALLDQTDALVQAYAVFKEELSARRFGHSNFRMVGLPHLTPEQLFFVAYGHDNCEASDTVHRRRRWLESGELPPEDRVNIPLMQFEEFTRAFACNSTAPMTANRRCPMVRTRTSQD
ncbi:uncharacterized protein [Dermacentor andersoni]|uniref:uncharacterized protein n=1 Tax=Dermacentor andersoni TaxID=34620 RepID=UPI002416A244|nr:uncharacterized protein LOC126536344 [Dermacentor andersoni]